MSVDVFRSILCLSHHEVQCSLVTQASSLFGPCSGGARFGTFISRGQGIVIL